MKRTLKDLGRDVRDISLRISAIEQGLAKAVVALRDDEPGYPSSSMGGGGAATLNEDGSPPGLERYLFREDAAAAALKDLDRLIAAAQANCAEAHRIVQVWSVEVTIDPVESMSGQGECVVCTHVVAGTIDDRLRAGLCPRCYQSWRRWIKANKGDRHDWKRTRRVELSELVLAP
jgi:hypothetical protein